MGKIKIVGSVFSDTDITMNVCSHLAPILEFLKNNGIKWKKGVPLYTDKGGAHTLFVTGKINFSAIDESFEIPDFIELNKEYKSVICRKCWCDIAEKS